MIDAKGGLDALRKVRTVVADAETTFRMEQGTLASTTKTYVGYPDRFRVDATMPRVDVTLPAAQVVQVFNAGTGWVRDPSGVHDAPEQMRAEFAASVRRDTIPMLIAAAEGKLAVRLLPEEGRGARTFKVLEVSGEGLPPVKLFVDAQTLIARQAFTIAAPQGPPLQAEEVFSDYRRVESIQVPFKAELLHNGRPILSRTLTSVTLNGPLDDALFRRPQ